MTASATRTRAPTKRSQVAAIGLVSALALIVAALAIPAITGWEVRAGQFPPLHSIWVPRVGPGTPAAILLGVLACVYAPRVALWSWRRLLSVVYAYGVAWMLALATVDGIEGVGGILDAKTEYLQTAREVTDIGELLRTYVAHIPLDSEDNLPVHLAGHPPGAVLFFIGLARIGLGSTLAAGLVVTLIAATTAIAVMLVARRLGAERLARAAAPFLTVGPAAIWMCVSADAVFAATAAWATLLLTLSATSSSGGTRLLTGLGAGLLYGACVMFSYGLPLLGVLAVTVLILTRSWRPLLWATPAALAVVLVFAGLDFVWWEAFPVLRERYWAGIAQHRPGLYWTWANLAAVAISAGPIVGAGLAVAVVEARTPGSGSRRAIIWLALAGLAMCILASLSQMSRAEVERIWLPFLPWMLLATGLLPARWRRGGIILQVAFALIVQHLLYTRW
jgi:hypothetical protein